ASPKGSGNTNPPGISDQAPGPAAGPSVLNQCPPPVMIGGGNNGTDGGKEGTGAVQRMRNEARISNGTAKKLDQPGQGISIEKTFLDGSASVGRTATPPGGSQKSGKTQ